MSDTTSLAKIDPAFLEQAKELARGAEVLPGGLNALAERLQKAKKENKPLRIKLGVDPTLRTYI